jgi:hypothetical protein
LNGGLLNKHDRKAALPKEFADDNIADVVEHSVVFKVVQDEIGKENFTTSLDICLSCILSPNICYVTFVWRAYDLLHMRFSPTDTFCRLE